MEFSTYATPTIVGEIKRHFRDKSWAIRVPRLQELRASISAATAELTQDLGRSPVAEIATKVGVTDEEVIEGLESANAYTTLSLDATDSAEDSALSMLDTIGEDDEALEHVENRESLKPLLEALDPRKHILTLRFFRGMTQSQIAAEIGVSQMHVSRLLNKTLAHLGTASPRTPPRRRQARCAARGRGPAQPSSVRASIDCGCGMPASTMPATTARATATQVVSPPRKLQATRSWITWATTIGARAQDLSR